MPRPWAYVDTSLLAMRYLAEADTSRFRRMMNAHRLVTSAVTAVELRSVLVQRLAAGDITDTACRAISARLTQDRDFWDTIPVTDAVLAIAEDVVPRANVRTLDAVHIASAMVRRDAGLPALPFLTRDAEQAQGARLLGFAVLGIP
ncbi:MAG: type II toxin-antitoxin system VapC family toxin [Planctomycetes bacterium]|nr:type II toxin-antitoxin system VapC family toxin [Planctomycetota bacterium]